MNIYIINLEQSTDRLALQKRQFAKLGLKFERLAAVSVEDVSADFYQRHIRHGQRLMKQTEMACFLSHKKAWEKVVMTNQAAVILEDDAVLVHDFAKLLSQIEGCQLAGNIDLINLEVQPRNKIVSKTPFQALLNDEYHLYHLYLEKSGTGGYLIYPNGAKKLLQKAEKTLGLADAFIYGHTGLKVAQIEPAALLQEVICPDYGIPVEMPPKSLIGAIQNTVAISPNFWHRCLFKKNRIIEQLKLGLRTIKAVRMGVKRQINVNHDKFLSKKARRES
ncbi:glycosyltransferase family 25 protein [Moraxella oculi]|uniref:Glycosyltransferase family 25 protein n=1 Tax=Moraxella oculi TaxID=2940516 RepID=A0ABW8U3Q7_9GAMM